MASRSTSSALPSSIFPGEGRWPWPVLVVLLALALRAWVAIDQEILYDDAPHFLAAARLMLEGDFGAALAHPFHPLTAALIALTSVLGGVGLESAGLIVSVVSGGVATGALYLLGRDQFGESIGLTAGLLFAVHPRMVAAASNLQSDGVHLALFLVGALLAWRVLERGRFLQALGVGIVCGLAYLTRPEGLAIGVVLGVWIVADLLRKRISGRRFIRVAAGFATALLLFGGPYLVAMNAVGGSWVLTQKKRVVPIEWSLPEPARVTEALVEVGHDGLRAFHELFFVLALLGFRRGRPERRSLYLFSFAGLFLPVLFGVHLQAGYVSRRHWLVPVALLMPFAARGSLRVASWLRDGVRPLRARAWAVPAMLGLLAGIFVARELGPQTDPVKLARKEAALWLRQYDVKVLAAQRLRSSYYAGAERHIYLSDPTESGALGEWLRARGAEFVVAEEEALPPIPEGGFPGLREVHRVEYAGGNVLVLRVEDPPDVAAPGP